MTNIDNIWQEYAKNKSPVYKEKLVEHYAPLVKYVAGRLSVHIGSYMEFDDLVGYGVFGLLDAIDKYDYTKGNKFNTYAAFRIRGTIMDHIRFMDWVPRTIRQQSKQVEEAVAELEDELGRFPTDEEIAEHLEMTLEATQELMRKSTILSLVSLDDYLEQNHEPSFPTFVAKSEDEPEARAEMQEQKTILADAISKLREKERFVLTLYYYEDLTLREISSIMKVSESRVSQLHTRAIVKLQNKLGRYKGSLFQ